MAFRPFWNTAEKIIIKLLTFLPALTYFMYFSRVERSGFFSVQFISNVEKHLSYSFEFSGGFLYSFKG